MGNSLQVDQLYRLFESYNMSGKGKVLTQELVFNKTKSDNLQSIKNLNLWGNELEDLQLIERMPNLQVISLSVNKISSLRDFAKCNKLQELYLRKNCITDLREIRHLTKLPTLKVLWLHDNPCATVDNYREIVIHHLPNLVKLDNNIITPEEKQEAQKTQFDLMVETMEDEGYPTPAVQKQPARMEEKKPRPFSEAPIRPLREEKPAPVESNQWRGSEVKESRSNFESKDTRNGYDSVGLEEGMNRNKNIIVAVMSLVKQLDLGSLQLVSKEVERLMMNKYK